jgi:hypothetical protein
MRSNYGKLDWRDIIKGFALAIGGTLLPLVITVLQPDSTIEFTWAFWIPIIKTSFSAGLTYIFINLFSNSGGNLGKEK